MRLSVRLGLAFWLASAATLLVSVGVTALIARAAYGPPDWQGVAVRALDHYTTGGTPALRAFAARQRRSGLALTLLDGSGNALNRGVPRPLLRRMTTLADTDLVELQPRPGLRMAAVPLAGPDGRTWQLVAVQGRRPPRADPRLALAVQVLVSAVIVAAVGAWWARRIARPVMAVSGAARAVAEGDLGARVGALRRTAPDELHRLAHDFDAMAARVQALVTHQRTVLQDISHELRSPLARLVVALDLAARDAPAAAPSLAGAEREVQRLDALIGEILALARIESQLPGRLETRVDLADLTRQALARAADAAAEKQVTLNLTATQTVPVRGDAALLARALDNVLANAIKFSPPAGAVEVMADRHGDDARVRVSDHGPGVPETELALLFRPFFRGSNADRTPGSGLGLAIVARVMDAHGGSATAACNAGLSVTLTLPLAAA